MARVHSFMKTRLVKESGVSWIRILNQTTSVSFIRQSTCRDCADLQAKVK